MSNNVAGIETRPTAIAISQAEDKLRAVCLQKQGYGFEVLWTKSSEVSQTDWHRFATECGLLTKPTGQAETDGNKIVAAGFDSAGVVFYRIDVPSVKEEEIAAMVRLQAEARLPLPAEQMELAWRSGQAKNGQVAVTMAAARREQLQGFVENVREFKPTKILLDCEGIVKAWRQLFSGDDKPAVVVSIGVRSTRICLAESGKLINAVSLDMGIEDFSAAKKSARQAETAERFAQDTRSVLELFGYAEPTGVPVFVLSDGSGMIETIVSCLGSAGLNVKTALPKPPYLAAAGTETKFGVEETYEYGVPIGLALMALDSDAAELDIFERLYSPVEEGTKKDWLHSLSVTSVIAAVMLALVVIVFYAVDVATLNAIEKRLRGSEARTGGDLLVQRQKLIRTIALQRPDLLELLNQVNSSNGKGIMLDSLYFKKGQPVSISGNAQNTEQLYEFEKTLLSKNGIKEVKIRSQAKEAKGGKLKFTITFHYKNFTKKGT